MMICFARHKCGSDLLSFRCCGSRMVGLCMIHAFFVCVHLPAFVCCERDGLSVYQLEMSTYFLVLVKNKCSQCNFFFLLSI